MVVALMNREPWTKDHLNILGLGLKKFQTRTIFLNTGTEFLNLICGWWKFTAHPWFSCFLLIISVFFNRFVTKSASYFYLSYVLDVIEGTTMCTHNISSYLTPIVVTGCTQNLKWICRKKKWCKIGAAAFDW